MAGKAVPSTASGIGRLLAVMAALRDPDGGCPWDLEQDFASIAPYTIEEAYEVADAIDRGDMGDLREELGDLLLQVVFHSRMAEEQGLFDFEDVAGAIADKMVRRHPHVFGGAAGDGSQGQWDAIKRREREAAGDRDTSALAGIARGLPEWQRALKLQKRAARVGFDWPGPGPVFDKLYEEAAEVRAEFAAPDRDSPGARERLEEELGDLLFVAGNLARHAGVDPGAAMRRANLKFERRFRDMEAIADEEGRPLESRTLEEQETLWQRAKRNEKDSPGP